MDSELLQSLDIIVDADAQYEFVPSLDTDYSYTLAISPPTPSSPPRATIAAATEFGAMYALESFSQLLFRHNNNDGSTREQALTLPHNAITIDDSPSYRWRGLMLDVGRRFFPIDSVRNIMDTMAAVKLNVLHFHLSDQCRFGVESHIFPNLTASLTGIKAGFYTQKDVADIVSYASDRGIRVVPEFDLPGHSRGYIPIQNDAHGVEFCTTDDTRSQLFGDSHNKTYDALHALMKASLFPDEVFNIGCDETSAKGLCSVKSTFSLERQVLTAIEDEFNKTAEGWEEVFF